MMLNSQTWQQYPLIKDQLVAVNHTLQTHINAAHPTLQAALLTMANHGGKYLRPTMLLLMAKAINDQHDNDQQLIHLASSIEVLHMASLIHDDIIDDSPMRRGAVSIQAQFGKDTAVYAGDYLFTVFFDLLIKSIHEDKYLQVNAQIMQQVGGQAVLGRQPTQTTPWLTERHGYDPTSKASMRYNTKSLHK